MILGFVEHADGIVDELSLQMATLGSRLAAETGTEFGAVLAGDGAKAAAEALSGVSRVYLVEHPLLAEYAPVALAESLVQLIASTSPRMSGARQIP